MKEGGGALKTATAVVGLLAGVVAAVYVLGGLVIALRLLFDHFSMQGAVTAVGQIPRTTVITTALLNVLGAATCVGLLAAMVYGLVDRPRARATASTPDRERPATEAQAEIEDRLTTGSKWRVALLFAWMLAIAVLGSLPALLQAIAAEDVSPLILPCVFAAAITYGVAAAGFYLIRRIARRDWARGEKALAAGAVWAVIAIVPALMLASAKPFENARVCLAGDPEPVEGRLIGETSDRVLLEEEFNDEAAIVSLPADQVARSEYGDVEQARACSTAAPGDDVSAEDPDALLEGHGSPREVAMATRLRPYLLFDSGERWRPLAVDAFLAEPPAGRRGHRFCHGDPDDPVCEAATGPAALRRGAAAPDFIDIGGDIDRPSSFRAPLIGCDLKAPALDCDDGSGTAIYYRRTSFGGRWYWDFWWFMRFNDYTGRINECRFYCGDHEGDWEGITVITTAAVEPQILGAIYAAHKDRVMVEAEILPRSGDHPLAFVARGTHATYPFPCGAGRSCKQFGTVTAFRLPEEHHDGAVAWSGNGESCAEQSCVRPLPEAGRSPDPALPFAGTWARWPGLWGETCVERCKARESSPRSPGLQDRYKCPWAPTRWALVSPDGTTSRSEPAGGAERILARCKARRAGL